MFFLFFPLLRGEIGKHISDKNTSIFEKHYGLFLCTHEEMQLLDMLPNFHGDAGKFVAKK